VSAVAFAPDGKTVASAGKDRLVRLWDFATGRELRRFAGHGEQVECVLFTRDGKTLVSGAYDGTIRF
jgi:WD40 repeat protein